MGKPKIAMLFAFCGLWVIYALLHTIDILYLYWIIVFLYEFVINPLFLFFEYFVILFRSSLSYLFIYIILSIFAIRYKGYYKFNLFGISTHIIKNNIYFIYIKEYIYLIVFILNVFILLLILYYYLNNNITYSIILSIFYFFLWLMVKIKYYLLNHFKFKDLNLFLNGLLLIVLGFYLAIIVESLNFFFVFKLNSYDFLLKLMEKRFILKLSLLNQNWSRLYLFNKELLLNKYIFNLKNIIDSVITLKYKDINYKFLKFNNKTLKYNNNIFYLNNTLLNKSVDNLNYNKIENTTLNNNNNDKTVLNNNSIIELLFKTNKIESLNSNYNLNNYLSLKHSILDEAVFNFKDFLPTQIQYNNNELIDWIKDKENNLNLNYLYLFNFDKDYSLLYTNYINSIKKDIYIFMFNNIIKHKNFNLQFLEYFVLNNNLNKYIQVNPNFIQTINIKDENSLIYVLQKFNKYYYNQYFLFDTLKDLYYLNDEMFYVNEEFFYLNLNYDFFFYIEIHCSIYLK